MINDKPKKSFRLLIKKIVGKGIQRDGQHYIQTEWSEVPEISLGSVNKPNEDIIEFAFEPLSDDNQAPEFLRWFRGLQ